MPGGVGGKAREGLPIPIGAKFLPFNKINLKSMALWCHPRQIENNAKVLNHFMLR